MKARYRTLDAMRGVAALTVVVFHTTYLLGDCCTTSHRKLVPFGYLAVDLFFVLSGFVIAYSYDEKFRNGYIFKHFMAARLGRLLPIYAFGLLLGIILPMLHAMSGLGGGKRVILSFIVNIFMLPVIGGTDPQVPFPLDPPAWSLFFELWVANTVFAATHRYLNGKTLTALIGVSFTALLLVQYRFGSIDVGAYWTSFVGSIPRVLLSFFVGVALSRFRRFEAVPSIPAWVILLVLEGSFWIPVVGSAGKLYEVFAVVILYPLLVFAGSRALERRPQAGIILGDASYAIYAIHVPLAYLLNAIVGLGLITPSPLIFAGYLVIVVSSAILLSKADTSIQKRIKPILNRLVPSQPGKLSTAKP